MQERSSNFEILPKFVNFLEITIVLKIEEDFEFE